MSNIFISVLNMSFTASFIALVVALIRLPLKKAPKVFSYILWAAVFFHLACPFSFELPLSLNPVTTETISQNIGIQETPVIKSRLTFVESIVNDNVNNILQSETTENNSGNSVQTMLLIGSWIWISGVCILLLYTVISYICLKHRLRNSILIQDNVYETDRITTPFVLSLISPKIYIPVGLSAQELMLVLSHENVHIKRRDYLIKPLAFLITILHWFNPIVWLSYTLLTKDMELSADETALKKAGMDIRREYSILLYSLSAKTSGLLSPLGFGEGNTKLRIKNALNYKKPAVWVNIVAMVVILLVCIGFTPQNSSVFDKLTQTESLADGWSGNFDGKEITLAEAEALIAKGDSLKFDDFVKYSWINVSSNLHNYIMVFPVESGSYRLIIDADESKEITSIRLEKV